MIVGQTVKSKHCGYSKISYPKCLGIVNASQQETQDFSNAYEPFLLRRNAGYYTKHVLC